MSEYTEVERPFLDQLEAQGWTVIDQGQGVPQDATASLRQHFRQALLPGVFDEAVQALLFKAQADRNELTGEADPVVRFIDFHTPANSRFHAINQFRVDTPGCVKPFIIPDIVLFVNGIPLVVVECKKGSETCANPMQEAFVQPQRYVRRRAETEAAGLKEGEPRLFHSNLRWCAAAAQRRTTARSPRKKNTSTAGRRCTRRTTRRWPA